jgi:xylulokinase
MILVALLLKASLIDITTGQAVAAGQSPSEEMPMLAVRSGWAEQDPALWWDNAVKALENCLKKSKASPSEIVAIGSRTRCTALFVLIKTSRYCVPPLFGVIAGPLTLERLHLRN